SAAKRLFGQGDRTHRRGLALLRQPLGRDIELTTEQHASLRARNPAYNGQRIGAKVRSRRARDRRLEAQRHGRALARGGDPMFVVALPPASAARGRVPPLLALPLWLAVYFTWHLPWLYDLALRHPHSLLHLEHVSYLVAGCLFWWPVIRGDLPAGATAAYLFG